MSVHQSQDMDCNCMEKTKELKKLQIAQNNMLRTLENVRIKDRVSIKSLLKKNKMLSVNQTNAQIKLLEMWKSVHHPNYPNKVPTLIDIAMAAYQEGKQTAT